MGGEQVQREGHVGGRRVVTLEHEGVHLLSSGLEKPRLKKKKKQPSGFFVFLFFGFWVFLYICLEEIVFGFFQFQEYFQVHPDFKL